MSVTPSGGRQKETRSFTTMTAGILALADWLTAAGCTQVAMESTGVYWKPIWNLLEGRFEVLLVNAQHSKRTWAEDLETGRGWIADLLQHDLASSRQTPQRECANSPAATTPLAERPVINRLQKVRRYTGCLEILQHCCAGSRYPRGSA